MTAEIAILNKTAVALAADSKVTLSREGRQKTYDTVDKLFSLSKTEPVGAMIYGNAEFIGFPWETIVKEYRRKRPRRKFDTVFAWADDFLQFLLTFLPFTPADEDNNAVAIAQAWVQQVMQRAMRAAADINEFRGALASECIQLTDELRSVADFLSDGEWSAINARASDAIDKVCADGIMQNLPNDRLQLRTLADLAIRKITPSPASSGLVIAGFGEKELLPSLVSYDIDGILAGRIKAVETNRFDTTRQSRGGIIPFAQTDMVYRFMEGIDPDYAMLVHESVKDLLLENALTTAASLGHDQAAIDTITPALKAAAEASAKMFWDTNERIKRERFISPIIDMTMSLPKDELANLAESLVSLTSVQRRVSREIETVGGAIDVAVISKGDGFVWIKRKHYFSPDRNIRFINAYFADQNQGEDDDGHNA